MHGRQKSAGSPEEDARKLEKVKTFRAAMSKIFAKRKIEEYDSEMLQITSKVLLSNPDITTLWNIRREALSLLKSTNCDAFHDMMPKELQLVESCLRQNPKSYNAWHHRCWIMIETEFQSVDEEINLCSKYLKYDDRNFHCWDYRKFLVDNSKKITPKQELDFTTEKIQTNFSNYSSWHLRSMVLPQITKDFLSTELNLVKNAAFTDPNDQSVWFYHKWLVNSHLQNVSPRLSFVSLKGTIMYFVFTVDVNCPCQSPINLRIFAPGNQNISALENWSNPWNKPKCKLWTLKVPSDEIPYILEGGKTLELGVFEIKQGSQIYLGGEAEKVRSLAVMEFLTQEKDWIEELYEIEAENKCMDVLLTQTGLILTLIHLLRLIDYEKNKDKINSMIDTLQQFDGLRRNYYVDMRCKFELENKLKRELQLSEAYTSHILPPF